MPELSLPDRYPLVLRVYSCGGTFEYIDLSVTGLFDQYDPGTCFNSNAHIYSCVPGSILYPWGFLH